MDSILEPILNKNSTKKLILDNLIELQPQTLKEIHFKIKKLKNISYQATHKAIQEMQQENLIQKDNKKYSINQFWIDSLSKKLDQIKQNQEKENFKKKYFFDTYSTFAKFIIDQAATIETNNLPSICVMEHSWPPLGLDQNDLLKITLFLKKGQYYDLTINNTPLDIAFAKTLEKMGKTVKIGSKFKLKNDFLIQGNTIIDIIFEDELKNTIHKIFKKHKQLNEIAIQEIITKIVTQKNNIQVTTYQDEIISNKLRKVILKEFK